MYGVQTLHDLEYRSDESESASSKKSAATSISATDSEKPEFLGYARFAPNAVPTEVPNADVQRETWEKIISRDGIAYFYNWHNGGVRFDDAADQENEDPLVKRANEKNPHLRSLRRPGETRKVLQEEAESDEVPKSILEVNKYRGRGGWKAVFDRTTRKSHWEDRKGRKLSNDLPRWFGPITLHV
mmetsp:Transcript_3171/g.7435  ORF Transcript_3171/g.7435 Transcript_3171/m.7435 type:complete len:185 (-) Transcript_3171:544-1098(-)|eukprot:g11351.t1